MVPKPSRIIVIDTDHLPYTHEFRRYHEGPEYSDIIITNAEFAKFKDLACELPKLEAYSISGIPVYIIGNKKAVWFYLATGVPTLD